MAALPQTKAGKTPDFVNTGNVTACLFDRKSNQSLNICGPEGGCNGYDLNLIIGNIGNGINGQFGGFVHTKDDKGSRKQPYDEFVPYGKLDDFIKHNSFN